MILRLTPSRSYFKGYRLVIILSIFFAIFVSCFSVIPFSFRLLPSINDRISIAHTIPAMTARSSEDFSELRQNATAHPSSWFEYLQSHAPNGNISTQRLACREYENGAQACSYEGFICIDTAPEIERFEPIVYFVDDTKEDGIEVPNDNWCNGRHQSTSPKYYGGSKVWPIMNGTVNNGTFAPQMSCLKSYYRTSASLLGRSGTEIPKKKIKWLPSLWLVNLDRLKNEHNYHLFMGIIWMLDVQLWQRTLDLQDRPDQAEQSSASKISQHFFDDGPRHVYLPQSVSDFDKQTGKDLNRLIYALILDLDLKKLYPNHSREQLTVAQAGRWSETLRRAYPELLDTNRLMFHKKMQDDPEVNLVCAPRFATGPKIGNGAHERTCRHLRNRGHNFFGIEAPEMRRLGQIYYRQPPKRIVILDRHLSRRIENAGELEEALKKTFGPDGVEVEYMTTAKVETAEDQVRYFRRAGVLITPHGSQAQSMMWMPRYSAIIEIMPVGYTDLTFMLLTESCKIWHYEVRSEIHSNRVKSDYVKECGSKLPHHLNPCVYDKSTMVKVNIPNMITKVKFALERIGYPIGKWLEHYDDGGLLGY